VGVVGIDSDKPGLLLTPEQSRLLDALSDQAALAIDRVNLAQDIDRARLAAETDRLRAALLTSISHDLRTPLASILGSASSLVTHGHEFDPTVQASLMRTILEEAERLQPVYRQSSRHDEARIRTAQTALRSRRSLRHHRRDLAKGG